MTTILMDIFIYVDGGWTSVLADTLSASEASADWGMASNRPDDRVAKTGTLSFSLKNHTGKYLPGGASVISADWDKGTKVKVVFTFNGESWVRFYGVVNKLDILKTPSNSVVKVSCVDWLDYAAKYPLSNPAIQLDKSMDEVITTVLDAMPIPPLARDISTGVNVFPTVFNDASMFTLGLSEFSKMAISEMGYIYVKKDKTYGETIRAESAASRVLSTPRKQVAISQDPGFLLQENGDFLLQENGDKLLLGGYTFEDVVVNNSMEDIGVDYGENLINRLTLTVNPTRIDTVDTQLYSIDSPIYFEPSAVKQFNVQFTEPNSKRLVAALPPEDSYPTALLHFDEAGTTGLISDDSGRVWSDFGVDLVSNIKYLGSRAAYFDGSNAYVYAPSADIFEFGSDNFTVEWWEYRLDATSGYATIRRSDSAGFIPWKFGESDGTNSKIYITSNGASWDIANGRTFGAIATQTWTHYSICRVGNTFYARKNGLLTDTWTSSATILASTASLYIGGTSTCINAIIDEVRITKGLGRYATTFTPQTEPYSLSGLIYSAWTNRGGDGTELTADFDITVSYGAAGATLNVTNSGTVGGWLNNLKIFGKVVENTSPISDVQEDAASIARYSHHELIINQVYQQDFTTGREEGAKILGENKTPLIRVNNVTMNANKSEAHTRYFLETDVGDVVKIVEPTTETNADYFIQGMNWKASAGNNGVIVDFGWTVKKFREALSALAIQFADLTTNDNYLNFGYQAAVSADNVPYRIWSYWFKSALSRQDASHITTKSAADGSATGRGYTIYTGATGRLSINAKYGNVMKQWRADSAIPNVNDTWHHVFIAHDTRSSGTPIMYVNGSAVTPSLISSTTTDNETEVGTELKIGYGAQDTSMKDIRIYNGDQVADPAALAVALYAETPYGDANTRGLLFRTFYAPTNELADYEGDYLTEDQKVFDDIGFAAGTPIDDPLGEAL
jgi:hypothetical protein